MPLEVHIRSEDYEEVYVVIVYLHMSVMGSFIFYNIVYRKFICNFFKFISEKFDDGFVLTNESYRIIIIKITLVILSTASLNDYITNKQFMFIHNIAHSKLKRKQVNFTEQ